MSTLNIPSYNTLIPREKRIRAIQELYGAINNGGGGGTVETEGYLSPTSTSPVASKVITNNLIVDEAETDSYEIAMGKSLPFRIATSFIVNTTDEKIALYRQEGNTIILPNDTQLQQIASGEPTDFVGADLSEFNCYYIENLAPVFLENVLNERTLINQLELAYRLMFGKVTFQYHIQYFDSNYTEIEVPIPDLLIAVGINLNSGAAEGVYECRGVLSNVYRSSVVDVPLQGASSVEITFTGIGNQQYEDLRNIVYSAFKETFWSGMTIPVTCTSETVQDNGGIIHVAYDYSTYPLHGDPYVTAIKTPNYGLWCLNGEFAAFEYDFRSCFLNMEKHITVIEPIGLYTRTTPYDSDCNMGYDITVDEDTVNLVGLVTDGAESANPIVNMDVYNENKAYFSSKYPNKYAKVLFTAQDFQKYSSTVTMDGNTYNVYYIDISNITLSNKLYVNCSNIPYLHVVDDINNIATYVSGGTIAPGQWQTGVSRTTERNHSCITGLNTLTGNYAVVLLTTNNANSIYDDCFLKSFFTYFELVDKEDNYESKYLTFEAIQDSTFTFTTNALQYSVDDGITWTTLAAGTASPIVTAGNKIMWKQTGLTPDSSNGIGTFSSTGNFNAYGNIMSLYYGDNFENKVDLTGKNYAFKHLFKDCTTLVSAENLILPATTLAVYCYNYMFRGCTSLTTAPALPATTLVLACYYGMFKGCTSLTTAPILLATTLGDYCYRNMFDGCSLLSFLDISGIGTSIWEFYSFLYGTAASGTVIIPEGSYAEPQVPSGWTVYYKTIQKESYDKKVTSSTSGLKLEVVASMPANPDSNTVYIVQ